MDENEKQNGFGAMHRHIRWVSLVAIFLSIFLIAESVKTFKSISYVGEGITPTNTITVDGTGDVVGIPDTATFSFSVQNESMVVADAQSASAKKVNAIIDFLKKSGIKEADIKTTGYDIYPRYEYQGTSSASPVYYPPSGKQVLAAYVVNQTVTVKVRNTADAGTILSGVGGLGATNISGLSFTFDKQDDLANQARSKAIMDAKSKASALASALGVQLVRIVGYSEGGNRPIYYAKADAMSVGMGAGPVPAVPVGENTITSTVSITYEIR